MALSKKFLGSAVCPGFLASLATVLIGPPDPPDAAALDPLKDSPCCTIDEPFALCSFFRIRKCASQVHRLRFPKIAGKSGIVAFSQPIARDDHLRAGDENSRTNASNLKLLAYQ